MCGTTQGAAFCCGEKTAEHESSLCICTCVWGTVVMPYMCDSRKHGLTLVSFDTVCAFGSSEQQDFPCEAMEPFEQEPGLGRG